jgi:hypothetical protein
MRCCCSSQGASFGGWADDVRVPFGGVGRPPTTLANCWGGGGEGTWYGTRPTLSRAALSHSTLSLRCIVRLACRGAPVLAHHP